MATKNAERPSDETPRDETPRADETSTVAHTHTEEATVTTGGDLDARLRPTPATITEPVPGSEGPRSQLELDQRDAS